MNNNELESEVIREIDLEIEKEKLEQVIEVINNEILEYLEKRKQVSDQILNYREKALEEFRNDEDKIAEYFDHERYVKEESFKAIDRKLKELVILKDSPYFGRVDFRDLDFEDKDTIYIGRFGVTTKDDLEPVIVDWRSPVSSLFYSGKIGNGEYTAPAGKIQVEILKKRQYIVKNQQLMGCFDSELDIKDEILQMVLSANTEEKLKDIVMTIQEEQDKIIRQPKYDAVVVDGVAGSGKTTIALHRVAYLLYNYREVFQDKVLIIGPNTVFMEYISRILPSLGEVGTFQTTFLEFAMDFIHVEKIMSFNDYIEKIVNNEADFINKCIYKSSSEYADKLDDYINKLMEEYFVCEDVLFDEYIVIKKEEVEKLIKESFISMPLFRRNKRIRRIIFSKLKDIRDIKFKEIDREFKEVISMKSKEELEEIENELIFQRRNKIRDLVKKVMDIKKSLTWLEPESVESLYNKFNNNDILTIDDLAPILYLKIKLEGIKYDKKIKHVVIDEAQDYSEIQFRVIKEITGCSGFTIVGDKNQRIIPYKGEAPFNNLDKTYKDLNVSNFKLNKSYRSTAEIMKYANKYLKEDKVVPIVRNGDQVKEIVSEKIEDLKEKLLETVEYLKAKEYETIGIICKNAQWVEYIGDLIKEHDYIKIFRNDSMAFGKGVMILPVYLAKGLEFDAAIIIDNEEEVAEDNLKYIMATRALHELVVFKHIVI